MLKILTYNYSIEDILGKYPPGSIEKKVITVLNSSNVLYNYNSLDELDFELKLRSAIIDASIDLYNSNFSFKTFDEAICNDKFWDRTSEGGFLLKKDVKPSAAIKDIYINSSKYGTECATAIVILHFKALLDLFPEELFNELFPRIYLMNWRALDHNLKELGYMEDTVDYLPGDRLYIKNPDVDPETPEFQGENIIDLGNGMYYGHGIGIGSVEEIIRELNKYRKKDSSVSSYLLDSVSRPNFRRLYKIYDDYMSTHRYIYHNSSYGLFIRYPRNPSFYP